MDNGVAMDTTSGGPPILTPSHAQPPQTVHTMSPEEVNTSSPLVGQEGGGDLEPPEGSTTTDKLNTPPPLFNCGSPLLLERKKASNECESVADSLSDVEKFDGKIVYNPDGSAYIIEGGESELSDDDADVPRQEGSIVDDGRGGSQPLSYPQIANAIYVSRNSPFYQAIYGQAYMNLLQEKKLVPEAPNVHSYRVYSLRDKSRDKDRSNSVDSTSKDLKSKFSYVDYSSVPIKPILMCFVCKLSFGYTKSFVAHAMNDHNLQLNDNERDVLNEKNISAIIQCVGKDKEVLVSFLEPVIPTSGSSASSHQTSKAHPVYSSCPPSSYINTHTVSTETSSPGVDMTLGKPISLPSSTMVPSTCTSRVDASSDHDIRRSPSVSECDVRTLTSTPIPFSMPPSPYSRHAGLDLSRKMPNNLPDSLRRSMSPITSGIGKLNTFSTPGMITGTTIGACPEHISGRPSGVECANCDLILSSSHSLSNQMPLMQSRNSCKTLKCPKCNWHYKYQETLEIHMKEKHPDNETSCIYCITNQPHPRLARGESYTCGYKPYRCEVCNYSTTTKGNLSIHMQSDKHLNNIQELQNSGAVPNQDVQQPPPPPPQHCPHPPLPASSPSAAKVKPKPTWRCDVCNYETNVARNLRIHMTSEKHTHNMMVLQQNVKHMQQLNAFQQAQVGLDPSSLMQFMPGMGMSPEKCPPHTEAALADMAYNQALLIQMMTSGQIPSHMGPDMSPHLDLGLTPEMLEQQPDAVDPNPKNMYHCCICTLFSTDSIEALNHHLTQDRTKTREQEVLMVVAGNFICKLCSYKTNLKANFQLHCKTDKHLQRLQHVNHIKEGGPRNEWRLKYLNLSNPVQQVRCNACDFYTNSTHKLQLHVASQQHEIGAILYWHLARMESNITDDGVKQYLCTLCSFQSKGKINLVKHVRTMGHLQMENLHQLRRRSEGKESPADIADIFQVKSQKQTQEQPAESEQGKEPNRASSTESSSTESMLKQVLKKEKMDQENSSWNASSQIDTVSPKRPGLACPLCQEMSSDRKELEQHLIDVHSVKQEGLSRLLLLVDDTPSTPPTTKSLTPPQAQGVPATQSENIKQEESNVEKEDEVMSDTETADDLKCQTCSKNFKSIDDLYMHQNETGHLELKQTPRGPGYLCWKKGCNQYFPTAQGLQIHFREIHFKRQPLSVSERHVYKYRCNQCSLAFKTLEKLQLHSQYHMIREATKCVLCGRSFRSVQALQKHVETSHTELSETELQHYKLSLLNNPLLLAGMSGQVLDPATTELLKKESLKESDEEMEEVETLREEEREDLTDAEMQENGNEGQLVLEDYLNSQAVAEDSYNDPNRKYKCHRCKVAFTRQGYLTSHNKTLLHRKGEKLSYPMEKYLDPNRPYKCEVCKESFTQKNILLVHYNSVSHLHKLKRQMREQQQQSACQTPPQSQQSRIPTSQGNLQLPSLQSKEDDDKKPYKCNICKVAYSQGSTLDIHMRSVLHQTRAAKLQELALTGQVDISRPLIEQPEPQKAQEQQKKILQDMLNPKPLAINTSVASSVPQASPVMTLSPSPLNSVKSSPNPPVSQSSQNNLALQGSNVSMQPHLSPQAMLTCQRCNVTCVSQEQLFQHQQLCSLFQSSLPFFQPLTSSPGGAPTSDPSQMASHSIATPPTSVTPDDFIMTENAFPKFTMPTKKSSHIHKHLLENFGFELVMQFNEYHQRRLAKIEEKLEQTEPTSTENNDQEMEKSETPVKQDEQEAEIDIPEISRSECSVCKKQFSSVWVLKAHTEEIHKQFVPQEYLEKFVDNFKKQYEEKISKQNPEKEKDTDDVETKANPPASDGNTTPRSSATPTPVVSTPNNDIGRSTPCSTTASSTTPTTSQQVTPTSTQPSAAPNFIQQINDMNAAFSVMAAQQMQQMNPMMMGLAGLSMGLPFGMNMPALAAMNLQPPLVPFMMPPPLDPMSALLHSQNNSSVPPAIDQNLLSQQQKLLQQQQASVAAQQKRARTRITDEQLKILRAHFDINNSPTEEQISDMAQQSGLPPKVIKHWFRNTLFKERQRNKDSPYNFNNPPSTTLNLEEYERTGETKMAPLGSEKMKEKDLEIDKTIESMDDSSYKTADSETFRFQIKSEPGLEETDMHRSSERTNDGFNTTQSESPASQGTPNTSSGFGSSDNHNSSGNAANISPITTGSGSGASNSSPIDGSAGVPRSCSPANLSLTSIITSQLNSSPSTHHDMFSPKLNPMFAAANQLPISGFPGMTSTPNANSSHQRSDFGQGPQTPQMSFSTCSTPTSSTPSTPTTSGATSGKRANRTRFTDYQIKVLQEFFENNAYPKDDDLEYLSKLLNLSPRVIVVWFQNARQKARKVYENQPPLDTTDEGAGRFQRTPGLNYQCKKCLLVFQRYYELIRHQKSHCFKEEDAKRSAQAQAAAAAAAAAALGGVAPPSVGQSDDSNSGSSQSEQIMSSSMPCDKSSQEGTFQCEQCKLVFPRFDLWREHQIVHIMNPNLFPSFPQNTQYPGMMSFNPPSQSPPQQQQQHHQQPQQQQQQPSQQQSSLQQQQLQSQHQEDQQTLHEKAPSDISHHQLDLSPQSQYHEGSDHGLDSYYNFETPKRKLSETDTDNEGDIPKDKRLRTTILPEQLDLLYQKYQIENNPSRKMLEDIANEVGLTKRVVQVWFQNTRARERKGQYRAHAQVINKRCPFCPALFKVRSALESHLASKHPEQYARGDINIDNLPDEEGFIEHGNGTLENSRLPPSSLGMLPVSTNSALGFSGYEEALRQFANDAAGKSAAESGMKIKSESEGDTPLDLSKPVDLTKSFRDDFGELDRDDQNTSSSHISNMHYLEYDNRSETYSESTDNVDGEEQCGGESSPTSPASNNPRMLLTPGKRFRTQMTNLQVKLMKVIFNDYKTPTMAECEMLGRDISLPKRVIQVWFQNARAKEKKYKLALQKQGQDPEPPPKAPEMCKLCDFKYSHKYSIQDHLFTRGHLDALKAHIESRSADDSQGGNHPENSSNSLSQSRLSQLQMLQMAAAGLPLPTGSVPHMDKNGAVGPPNGSGAEVGGEADNFLMQMYRMGIPPGYGNVNSFIQNMYPASSGLYEAGLAAGTPLAMLQLPMNVLPEVSSQLSQPGVSSVRFMADSRKPSDLGSRQRVCVELTSELGFICKACQLAFPTESYLESHQKGSCKVSSERGVLKLVQIILACRACSDQMMSVEEFLNHCESDKHKKNSQDDVVRKMSSDEALQTSTPIRADNFARSDSQMEDVVRKITALAQAKSGFDATDSNGNIAKRPRLEIVGESP